MAIVLLLILSVLAIMSSKKSLASRFAQRRLWLLSLFFLLLIVGLVVNWKGSSSRVADIDVVLLSGLTDVALSGAAEMGSGIVVQHSLSPEDDREYDQWMIEPGSLAYRSVRKQGVVAHEGSLAVRGMLLTELDEQGMLSLSTGLSHITFLMDSIEASGFENDGIKALFLDHVLSQEFLETDAYPFAQFVLDTIDPLGVDENGDQLFGLGGRLKIKDVIETIVVEDVVVSKESDDLLFLSGRLSISRYLWGLSLMPRIVDEFIEVEFDRGFSL